MERDEITIWTHHYLNHKLEAFRVKWTRLSPGADREGESRGLKIFEGNKLLFAATQEGESTSKNFGSGERYLGTTVKRAEEWKVSRGTPPVEFLEP